MAGRKSRRDGMTLAQVVAHYERMADWEHNETWETIDQGPCLELHGVSLNPNGYPHAAFPGTKKIRPVGHIILTHYVGAKPDGMEMCHACHNRLCIHHKHLRWDTHRANVLDMVAAGRQGQTKATDEDVRGIRWLAGLGVPQVEMVRLTGLSKAQVSRIVNGKRRMLVSPDPDTR